MAGIRNYYDAAWRVQEFTCPACSWSGRADDMVQEWYSELMDFSCPSCDKMILIVSYPTVEGTEEAAASGNPEAIKQLRKRDD